MRGRRHLAPTPGQNRLVSVPEVRLNDSRWLYDPGSGSLGSGSLLADGWWNLNYWNQSDAENACELFCALASATLTTCHPGDTPSSGDNPARRMTDIGESGSTLNFPTGPVLANSDLSETQNMSVTCSW